MKVIFVHLAAAGRNKHFWNLKGFYSCHWYSSTSSIVLLLLVPDELKICNWDEVYTFVSTYSYVYGIKKSPDGINSYSFNYFKFFENNCMEDI